MDFSIFWYLPFWTWFFCGYGGRGLVNQTPRAPTTVVPPVPRALYAGARLCLSRAYTWGLLPGYNPDTGIRVYIARVLASGIRTNHAKRHRLPGRRHRVLAPGKLSSLKHIARTYTLILAKAKKRQGVDGMLALWHSGHANGVSLIPFAWLYRLASLQPYDLNKYGQSEIRRITHGKLQYLHWIRTHARR